MYVEKSYLGSNTATSYLGSIYSYTYKLILLYSLVYPKRRTTHKQEGKFTLGSSEKEHSTSFKFARPNIKDKISDLRIWFTPEMEGDDPSLGPRKGKGKGKVRAGEEDSSELSNDPCGQPNTR